jgi:hypothetical protein
MSLATGRRIIHNHWTELPMPHDAIEHVGQMGRQQKMPKTLTFADRFGFELPDTDDEVDDEHDSDYEPDDADDSDDNSSDNSSTATSVISMPSSDDNDDDNDDDDDDDDDDNDDDDDDDDNIAQPLPGLSAGVDGSSEDDSEDDSDSDDDDSDSYDEDKLVNDGDTNDAKPPTINIPDETPAATAPMTPTGVGETVDITGVDDEKASETAGVGNDDESIKEETDSEQDRIRREMDERYGPRQHSIHLRDRKPRNYDHLFDYGQALLTFEDPMGELFLTEQMSLKKGLKQFGKDGASAVVDELRQLDYLDVIQPVNGKELTQEQQRRALAYHMYLKKKDVVESKQEDAPTAESNDFTRARKRQAHRQSPQRLCFLLQPLMPKNDAGS